MQVTFIYVWSDSSRRAQQTQTHTVDKKMSGNMCCLFNPCKQSCVCMYTDTHTHTHTHTNKLQMGISSTLLAKHPLVEGPCFTL